ncbi:MAG: ChaN family lipoprotein [Cocleimonas sp.]|nr:ChaN family lipoprotein [Cocleimonas sp.]
MKQIIAYLSLLLLSACSLNPITTDSSSPNVKKNPDTSRHINVMALKDTATLATITPQLAQSKMVLVGESHTTYGDHLNQLAIIKNLRPHWKQMAIGLEFVQYPFQQGLDDYIAGKINQEEMLRQTQWYDRWRYDFRLYRPIFEYAKQQKIPLIALNTPREITKRISKVGIKALNKKERAQLPQQIDQSNQLYRLKLEKVYSQHGGKSRSKKFERFYQAQLAWDETMADQAAKFIRKNPAYRMVILAGSGHLEDRHGIPSRLQRRIKSKPIVVLNGIKGTPSASQADYLLFSPESKLPKAGKMGIFMEDTAKGVLISKITKGSASAKAGLKKGDLITHLNNNKVSKIEDIKISLMDAQPKQKISLAILRAGKKKISKRIVLQ